MLCVMEQMAAHSQYTSSAPASQTTFSKEDRQRLLDWSRFSRYEQVYIDFIQRMMRVLVSIEDTMQRVVRLLPMAKATNSCTEPLTSRRKCVQVTTNDISKLELQVQQTASFIVPVQTSCALIDDSLTANKQPPIKNCHSNATLNNWNLDGDFAPKLTAKEAEKLTFEITPGVSHNSTVGKFTLNLEFTRYCVQFQGTECTNCSTSSCNIIQGSWSTETYQRAMIVHYELELEPDPDNDKGTDYSQPIIISLVSLGIAAVVATVYFVARKKRPRKGLNAPLNKTDNRKTADLDAERASSDLLERDNISYAETLINNNNNKITLLIQYH